MSTTTINRDLQTGAILNTDAAALNKYKVERNFYRKVDRIQTDLFASKEV